MDYHCRECGETFIAEPIIEFINGRQHTYIHCPCGSDRVIPIDEMIDEAEYMIGDR